VRWQALPCCCFSGSWRDGKFVRVGAERLPVVVGLCFLDTIKVPKNFFIECFEAMSFGFFKHGVKGSCVVLFRFDHVVMEFGPDLLFQLLIVF
jgi:hypothetical protein